MKRKISIILSITLFLNLSTITTTSASTNFPDLATTHWARHTVSRLVDARIIEGYPDGTFRPYTTLTIEQFVKMVVLALGEEVRPLRAGEVWSMPYLETAMTIGEIPGVVSGMLTCTEFFMGKRMHEDITRVEMTHIIHFAIMHQEKTNELESLAIISSLINDYGTIPENLKIPTEIAYHYGILTGYPDGDLKPFRSLNRAEGSTVVLRLLEPMERVYIKLEDVPFTESFFPVHAFDYSRVERVDFDTIRFFEFYWDPEADKLSYYDVDAPVIGGIKRTELIDYIIMMQNHIISKYTGPEHIFALNDLGKSRFRNDTEFVARYGDGYVSSFGFDEFYGVNNNSYQAQNNFLTSLAMSYSLTNFTLDDMVLYNYVNFSNTIINNPETYNTLQGYTNVNGLRAWAYRFTITSNFNMTENLKEDLYYALGLLFKDDLHIVTDVLDNFIGKETISSVDYKDLGFEPWRSIQFYGGTANNRAFSIMTSPDETVIIRISLQN